MMKLHEYKNVYFVGVGGIGMSGLARYFNMLGLNVSGYDKVKTPLTDQLEGEGIRVSDMDDPRHIPAVITNDLKHSLVVITPAIPAENKVLIHLRNSGYVIVKRAIVLAMISENTLSLAVAGTHGKTTTASMLAHIMNNHTLGCNAFLGGIASNYNSNIIINKESNVSVLEADEYDRSFLHLSPSIAVITSMDPDHLDIYDKADDFRDTFIEFAGKIKPSGTLVCHASLTGYFKDLGRSVISYGLSEEADMRAVNINVDQASFTFDISFGGSSYSGFKLMLPGKHNVENALAAIAVAVTVGVPWDVITRSICSYTGVQRRFQFHVRSSNFYYIDDYAHHPTEITAIITAARQLFEGKKITCIFQPHLFSRTKDFMKEFAEALSLFDEIILLEIYPAREKPISGVSSKSLLNMIPNANKSLFANDLILDHIIDKELEVLFTLGAGDISNLVAPLTAIFKLKQNSLTNTN